MLLGSQSPPSPGSKSFPSISSEVLLGVLKKSRSPIISTFVKELNGFLEFTLVNAAESTILLHSQDRIHDIIFVQHQVGVMAPSRALRWCRVWTPGAWSWRRRGYGPDLANVSD